MRRRTRLTTSSLLWEGRSKSWARAHEQGPPGGDLNLWMCAEDLGTEVWGQFHRLERNNDSGEREAVVLKNCSEELAAILMEALPYDSYGRAFSGTVAKFAKIVIQEFVLTGDISFEIRVGWEQEPGRMVDARLSSIPRGSLLGISPFLFQIVPRGVVEDEPKAKVVRLDAARVVTFRPPRKWRPVLSRLRRGFRLLGRSQHEWMQESAQGRFSESFKDVRRKYNVQLARLAAPIGWNFRGLIRDDQSDFHWAVRELQWKRLSIEIRDELLTTLRSVVKTIGRIHGESVDLEWRDLPTAEQVDDGLRRLSQGARFDEVLEPFRHR